MFCPACGVEYRPGFSRCSDCQVELVQELPAVADDGQSAQDLVTVFSCSDPVELMFLKSMLEQAAIPFLVAGEEIGNRLERPHAFPTYDIQVPGERAAEARSLIDELTDIQD